MLLMDSQPFYYNVTYSNQLSQSAMQEKIQNLKQSELTQVLADGFAELYHRRPQFPVTYLASYLKHHTHANNLKKTLLTDRLASNKEFCQQIENEENTKNKIQQQKMKQEKSWKEDIDKFLKKIEETEYHEDILSEFCTWLEDSYMLTGVYLGELKNKKKKIDIQQEDSEEAHFDPEAEKVIYFENYSKSHQQLLQDKELPAGSVLGKLLNPQANSEQEKGEEGDDKQENRLKDQIYFPSVVDNQELTFFRFPRLGAFYGLGIKIKSYANEKVFESNLTKVDTYLKAMEEYQKEKEQRQLKFREQYDEKAGSGAEEQQLEEMEKQFETEQQNFPKPQFPQFESVERCFVLGCDTLGQDRQISEQDRVKIRTHMNFIKEKWEAKQFEILKADIERHLKLVDKLEMNGQQFLTKLIEEEDKELPSNEQVEKYKDNEKLMELQIDTLRIQKIKEYLGDEKYAPFIEEVVTAKVLKFKEVIKYWLLFCNFSKEDINLAGTNLLDLRKAKKLIDENVFIDKIGEYNPRGSKPNVSVHKYAKWELLQQNLQKVDINVVASYNIYLAFILRFLILTAKVRQADRTKRVENMLEERKLRRQRLKENEEKVKIMEQKLAAAKAEAGQKQEQFDEEAWKGQYFEQEENQMAEVGEPIGDEIDRDLENGEQVFPEPVEQNQPQEQGENQAPE